MSIDHVSVLRSDYRAAKRGAKRAKQLEEQLNRVLQERDRREREISGQYQRDLNVINERLSQQQTQHSAELNRVSNDFREEIARQSAEFANTVEQINTNIGEINHRLTNMAEEYGHRFNEIAARTHTAQEVAQAHLRELQSILAQIRESDPERFAPGEVAVLQEQLETAMQNYNLGIYEAALSVTQVRLAEAFRLYARTVAANRLFIERTQQIRHRATEVATRFIDLQDNRIEFSIGDDQYIGECDVNYWSHGDLEDLHDRFNSIDEQLQNIHDTSWGFEELEEALLSIDEIDTSIKECELLAREEMIRSYHVEIMAQETHDTLLDHGWILENSGHVADDDRNAFNMVYSDGGGNELGIVISSQEHPENVELQLEVFGDYSNEVRRNSVKDEVLRQILPDPSSIERLTRETNCIDYGNAQAFIEERGLRSKKEQEQRRQSMTMPN